MPEGDDGETGDGSDAEVQKPGCPIHFAFFSERVGRRIQSESQSRCPSRGQRKRTRHHLRLQPGGLRGQLPVLPDGQARLPAQPDAGEIAGQVVAVFERHGVEVGRDRVNLVFMGMGEPFLNYDNFMGAVRLLVSEVGLSPQRMTVSTSGIVPGIERFAQEPPECAPSWPSA
jgi:23S rRNA (adenine2503-C2)-methyltransferase